MPVAARENTRTAKKGAAELMEELNADTAKLHAWIRTQANSPAQRPWFADTSDARGELALGQGCRQSAEDAAASLALARDQSLSSSRLPRSPGMPKSSRSRPPTGRAFC